MDARLRALFLLLVPLTAHGCKRASAREPDPLIVHEWGTFTSFEGVDGATVDGMQHESATLPAFVHSRLSPSTSPLALYGDRSRDVPVQRCQGKMETPVIYFHTRAARHVKVNVGFEGLLTQWYPSARATPELGAEGGLHALADVEGSSLEWELDLMPRSNARTTDKNQLAIVPDDSDWEKARDVDAADVRGGGERERYVFYRGLMHQVAQPTVIPLSDDVVLVSSVDRAPLHAAIALDVKGDRARFVALEHASGATTVQLGALRPKADVVREVEDDAARALVREGLFADEARAMVRTWSETWFSEEGTRLLYLVPRARVDQTLPLTITPTPDALVRVIVGRVEVLSPSRRAAVQAAVREHDLAALAKLGRFAEPAVRSVALGGSDEATTKATREVLADLAMTGL